VKQFTGEAGRARGKKRSETKSSNIPLSTSQTNHSATKSFRTAGEITKHIG